MQKIQNLDFLHYLIAIGFLINIFLFLDLNVLINKILNGLFNLISNVQKII